MMNGLGAPSSQGAKKRFVPPPVLPRCYLCGQQFGTTSIGIHIPQCYAKKLAQWQAGDQFTRGQAPKHPDTVNWKGEGLSKGQQNDQQFKEFVSNLETCPNCGRKFLADRLVVHLRSCKPGSSSKPVHAKAVPPHVSNDSVNSKPSPSTMKESGSASPASAPVSQVSSSGPTKGSKIPPHLDPKRNRVPGTMNLEATKLTCTQCGAVEYNADAKFCRSCGANLKPEDVFVSCGKCGESVAEGSRFCPSCGTSVESSSTSKAGQGDQTTSSPSGTTFEDAPSKDSSSPTAKIEYMYCETCKEESDDLTAIFCEECGNKMEKREKITHMPSVTKMLQKNDVSRERKVTFSSELQVNHDDDENCLGKRNSEPEIADDVVTIQRVECEYCGRRFASESLARHQVTCRKTKKRPVFNMTKQRLEGTDIPMVMRKTQSFLPAPPKHDWKKESEDFRKALRDARKVEQILKAGGDLKNLPPPTYSENPNYRQCPHCQRRFAPDVAERHIPKCASTVNRPKAPPKHKR